jgi:hypothetical protein
MAEWIKRKDFNKVFLPLARKGKQIWVVSKVTQLPSEIVNMALRLADLDVINFVRICSLTLTASSENFQKKPKVPVVDMYHETAIGIEILYDVQQKYIDFYCINSPIKGNGGRMVDAILTDLPKDWQPCVALDRSDGFWDSIKEKYAGFEWI